MRPVAAGRPAADRWAWRGIAGAVLVFVALASVQAWTIPIYQPVDEASHVGYGVVLAKGQGLPTIETLIPVDGEARRAGWMRARDALHQTIWVANHPPLYYALVAVPLGIGEAAGHGLGGVRAARLVSVGLSAIGLVLLGWLLLQLLPRRPQLAVVATGLVALVPTFVVFSSLVYNDSLAFLTTTATLAACTALLLRGPGLARYAAVAAAASAAALSRASGAFVVAVAGLAVLVAAWRAGEGGAWRRTLRAIVPAAAVGAVVAAAAGWFYLRNVDLYGSVTGTEALMQRFGRSPRGPALGAIISPTFWIDQQRRLWDISFNLPRAKDSHIRSAWLLVLVPAAGLLVAGARWLWRTLRGPAEAAARPAQGRAFRLPRVTGAGLVVAMLLLLLALLEYSVVQFNAVGGNPHVRYVFPGLATIGLLLAVGLAALPGGRRGYPALGMFAALVAVNVWGWLVTLAVYIRPPGGRTALRMALDGAGVSGAALLLPAGVVLAAGFAALAAAVLALGSGRWAYQGRGGTTLPASADDLGTVTTSPDLVRTTNPPGSTLSS